MGLATRRKWLELAGASTLATAALPAFAQGDSLLIFAAASLKNALDDAAGHYRRESGKPLPRISYAASNTLARQIEQGAPADLFLSADLDWMDYLAAKNLIRLETRISLLGNTLVLVGAKDGKFSISLQTGVDLLPALAGGRLALCDEAVPAGKYAKAALETLKAWESLKGHLAPAENVRTALLFVSRGEAPLGIVYQTDAAADANVRIIATFPPDSYPPIVYPAALTRESSNPDAEAFLAFLRGPIACAAFEKQGFAVLERPATGC